MKAINFSPLTQKDILYEDNHLIIINKKAGEIVQGDKTGDPTLIDKVKHYLKTTYDKPGEVFLGLTHRIDRPTSGIVIFAKTSKMLSRMNDLFKNRAIQKTYWAVTKKSDLSPAGTLTHHLIKNEKNNKSSVYQTPNKNTKEAILHYNIIAKSDNYQLLEVELETGRHHQIRAQLAYTKNPVKGDIKYGFPRTNEDGSIHLLARKITFEHPVKKHLVSVLAAVPENDAVWKALATD